MNYLIGFMWEIDFSSSYNIYITNYTGERNILEMKLNLLIRGNAKSSRSAAVRDLLLV